MFWIYQMNFQTIKESNAALRKMKGTPARRIYYRGFTVVFLIPLLVTVISPVIKGTFTPGRNLFLLVFFSFLMFLFFRRAQYRVLKNQLPARYCLTVKDGFLIEEITSREGNMSTSKRSLRDILQIIPVHKGLLIRLSGPSCLFLPEAAFRQTTIQESISFLSDAAAACKAEIPADSPDFPSPVEDQPEYGTVYFDLPSSHIYSLYMRSLLHLYRNPLRYVRIAFKNSRKLLLICSIPLLMAVMLEPRLLLPFFFGFLLFVIFLYALNLLLLIWKYYLMEKKDTLSPHCGPQYLSLYEDHLVFCRQEHTYQYSYHAFYGLYETKETFYLLLKNPASILLIPRWAFNSSQEETMFVRNLQGKLLKTNRH